MTDPTSCILCGHIGLKDALTTSDLLRGRPEIEATFVKCTNCGLFFQDPLPDAQTMDKHYSDGYLEFFKPGQSATTRAAARQVSYLKMFLGGGKLLDIGSGTGAFLAALDENPDWAVRGLEPDPNAAAFARKQYRLTIIESTLEATEFADESFDAVTLWDVLEHLHSPPETLLEIFRILRPGGWLIIRVPNASGWEAALFGGSWAGWDAPRHISAFSPETLEFGLKQAGFEPTTAVGGAEDYSSFAISVQFWDRQRKGGQAESTMLGSVVRSTGVRAVAYPLFWLSGKTSRRSRIVIGAQKPPGMQEAV